MKNKILCLILISAVVCSVFVFSASAQEEYVIEAGTYIWNETLSVPTDNSMPFVNDIPFVSNGISYTRFGVEYSIEGNIVVLAYSTPSYDTFAYSNTAFEYLPMGWADGISRTFSVESATTVSPSFYHWFVLNTSSSSSTLFSGYYRLKLPIDVSDPSWIGDGNTVWYNMRGRVVTDTSNRAFSFYRLGIKYNELTDDNGIYNGFAIDIVINDYNHDEFDDLLPYLEIYSVTYFADEDRFYYGYNDLVLDSFVGIALDGNYEVNNDFYNFFSELFEPYDYVYTGNPWFDIIDGVVDALKIDVFGSFSPWDIFITFIGISVFIWLLKLLAGG